MTQIPEAYDALVRIGRANPKEVCRTLDAAEGDARLSKLKDSAGYRLLGRIKSQIGWNGDVTPLTDDLCLQQRTGNAARNPDRKVGEEFQGAVRASTDDLCLQQRTGNAARNPDRKVGEEFQGAARASDDIDVLLSIIMRLTGFGSSVDDAAGLRSAKVVLAVWQKGRIVQGYDPASWRQDVCATWMNFAQYGYVHSNYGWEIGHIEPNGGDDLSNLQPLQWQNNRAKRAGGAFRVVTAHGNSSGPI
jgi:hypothetical protein